MTTKEIGMTALQNHGIGFVIKGNEVHVLLIDMTTIRLICPTAKDASEVRSVLMYYSNNGEHSGHEFKFDVTIAR